MLQWPSEKGETEVQNSRFAGGHRRKEKLKCRILGLRKGKCSEALLVFAKYHTI